MEELKTLASKLPNQKFLEETFDYLKKIEGPMTFIISSTFPTIDKIELSLQKGKRCFDFKTSSVNIVKEFATYEKDGYGFFKPIKLNNRNIEWIIPRSVAVLKMDIATDLDMSGELWEVESNFDKNKKKYFRLVIPNDYDPNHEHSAYLKSEMFAVGDTIKFDGFIEYHCNENLFNLFDYKIDKNGYLFIDSMTPMLYDEFEKSIGDTMYSLGVISGCIFRNEMYILQSENNDFKIISGFHYRKIEDNVISGMEIVSVRLLREVTKDKKIEGYISKEVFSNMVTKARNDNRFLRALKIITECNIYPLEMRASAYSIALETIKNIIIEENESKVNPFKKKNFASETISKLKEIIIPLDNFYFNNKEAILNKIEQLNQVTNKDSFKLAFALCGFQLTKIDEEALLKRNDFLHGRIPFEGAEESKQNQELKFITYKLHFLVTTLIMKYSKYCGYLKNNPKVFSVFAEGNKEINEPLFRNV